RPRRKKRRKEAKSNMGLILVGGTAGVLILVFGIVIVVAMMGNSKKDSSASGAPPLSQAGGANPGNRGQNNGQMDDEMMQRIISQMPAWTPDAGVVETLGDEITVADRYAIRLPKDFADKQNGNKGDGQHFQWTRSAAGGDAPTLTLNTQSSARGNPLQELQ